MHGAGLWAGAGFCLAVWQSLAKRSLAALGADTTVRVLRAGSSSVRAALSALSLEPIAVWVRISIHAGCSVVWQ